MGYNFPMRGEIYNCTVPHDVVQKRFKFFNNYLTNNELKRAKRS